MDECSAEALRKRTKDFAVRIIRLYRSLSRGGDAQVIGRQLLRCGTSVGANYRAACRARSRAEFIAKIGVVVEEADETMYWLELLTETNIVPAARLNALYKETSERTAIFTAKRRTGFLDRSQ